MFELLTFLKECFSRLIITPGEFKDYRERLRIVRISLQKSRYYRRNFYRTFHRQLWVGGSEKRRLGNYYKLLLQIIIVVALTILLVRDFLILGRPMSLGRLIVIIAVIICLSLIKYNWEQTTHVIYQTHEILKKQIDAGAETAEAELENENEEEIVLFAPELGPPDATVQNQPVPNPPPPPSPPSTPAPEPPAQTPPPPAPSPAPAPATPPVAPAPQAPTKPSSGVRLLRR